MGSFFSVPASGDSVTFKTLADLRAGGVPASNVSTAHMVNRVGPVDLAGGKFTWQLDPNGVLFDDDTCVIVPGGVFGDDTHLTGGAWVRDFEGPVKAIWAGLAGDGVTPDSVALSHADACVTQLFSDSGFAAAAAAVELPQFATVLIEADINLSNPLTVENAGGSSQQATLQLAAGVTATVSSMSHIAVAGDATAILSATFFDELVFRQCQFRNVAATFGGEDALLFESCWFRNFGALGTAVFQNDAVFNACKFDSGGAAQTYTFDQTAVLNGCLINPNAAAVYAAGMFQGAGSVVVNGGRTTNVVAVGGVLFSGTLASVRFDQVNFAGASRLVGNLANSSASLLGAPVQSNFVPVSGTVYQNTNIARQEIDFDVTLNPAAGADATIDVALQNNAAPATQFTVDAPATGLAGQRRQIHLSVPPGWFYSLTATNAAINSARVVTG